MLLKFILIAVCISTVLIFMTNIYFVDTLNFVYLLVGHWVFGIFYILAVMSYPAMNIHVQISVWMCFQVS